MINLARYREDLSRLIELGNQMHLDLTLQVLEKQGKLEESHQEAKKKVSGAFDGNYQRWYTEACAVIRQLLPNRLDEFEAYYRADPRRKSVDSASYKIQDWLTGRRARMIPYTREVPFDDLAVVTMSFHAQVQILESAESRMESSLFDIRQLVQADLFDSELLSARELLRNGFLRAAGAVSGVVLEKHLSQVCRNHGVSVRKKHPTIAKFNDLLKDNDVLDVPTWRFVQRLGDLRNLCGHDRQREPSEGEVTELIDGVDKVSKTLF
jgi:hypothetical protein